MERIRLLQNTMKVTRDDATRYRVSETIRDLGYLDFKDFCTALPHPAHIEVVERAFTLQA
jgi:hypothetical protein